MRVRMTVAVACAAIVFAALPPAPAAAGGTLSSQPSCPSRVAAGLMTCFARVLTSEGRPVHPHLGAQAQPFTGPGGYSPTDMRSAYGIPAGGGAGQTVAIIDAYDNPGITGSGDASDDLAVYRDQFALPACTVANGCFRKIDEWGGTSYPGTDSGWDLESDLDVDAVSSVAPAARILLVEAQRASFVDLGQAIDEAVAQGATEVSMSWGGPEWSGALSQDAHFDHPGIAFVASTGDSGYGVAYPSSSPYVVAAGGTTLTPSGSSWSEAVWQGTGGGCSVVEAKPRWQKDALCGMRTVADAAADADPATGLAMYSQGYWWVGGGTSLSAPLIAGMYAVAGGPGGGLGAQALYFEPATAFHDVTTGSNGSCGSLCSATTGYDSPSGLGSFAAPPQPGPVATLSPDRLAFAGTTVVGATAESAVTVSNTGVGTLDAGLDTLLTDTADFGVGARQCELAPGASCVIPVFFHPESEGTLTATLTVNTNGGSPSITLVGTGVASPPPPPPALGYTLTGSDGGLFSFGGAPFYGSTGGIHLNRPIVGMAETPTGHGYWFVASDGGIFAYGDAGFYGSMGGKPLNKPVVGMAATPSGHGYWLVASDGGIFSFGDAGFHGSTGAIHLNQPIVGMAASASGRGYRFVASDGGIFSFGDAPFYGSMGGRPLGHPIAGMAARPDGDGYWLAGTDGAVYGFGNAAVLGSTAGRALPGAVVGVASTATGDGYYLAGTDGSVYAFGDAPYDGSMGGRPLNRPIVGMAAVL